MDCKCGDCGYTLPALDGFPKHVFCKHYKLHMSNKADASRCDYFEKKPSTHFDEIKAMSVEELAEWLTLCLWGENREVPFLLTCTVDKWLDWLKQEAGE